MTKGVPLLERMCSTEGVEEAEVLGLILQKANLVLSMHQNQNCKKRVFKLVGELGFFSQVVKISIDAFLALINKPGL